MQIFSDNKHLFQGYESNQLGECYRHTFPSGESYCQLKENVRGEDVFLVANMSLPANDSIMNLAVQSDAARRASAKSITAVMPYMFYSRQDRKDKSRTPISAKLVLGMLEAAGINRFISLELHNPAIQGFTDLPFDNLTVDPCFYRWLKELKVDKSDIIVASPDDGGSVRALRVASKVSMDFGYAKKKRINDTTVRIDGAVGNFENKVVVLIDDITESCATLVEASNYFLDNCGAKEVYAFVAHAPLTKVGLERLSDSRLKAVVSTNTFPVEHQKLQKIDVSGLFMEAMHAVAHNTSISKLFNVSGA